MLFRLAYSLMLCGSASAMLFGLMGPSLLLDLPAVLLLGLVVRPAFLLCRCTSLGALLLLHTLLPSPLFVGSRCLIGSSLNLLPIARSGVVAIPA